MKTISRRLAFLLIGVAVWPGLHVSAAEPDGGEAPEVPVHPDSSQFSERLAAIGLTTAAPRPMTVEPQLTGYGRVLDPASLITDYAELAAARSALDTASRESARVQQLYEQGRNASQQAVEQAGAARDQAQVRVDGALAQLQATWGRAISSRTDLAAFVRTLASGESALVRVDLPLGSVPAATPRTARIAALGSDSWQEVEILGTAASADPRFQGRAYLGFWRADPLPPGTALRASVPAGGPTQPVLAVPRGAIVIYQGSPFVYVPAADGEFERRLVTLGQAMGADTAVTDGISASDRIVVTGAQELLATEILGLGGEEEGD